MNPQNKRSFIIVLLLVCVLLPGCKSELHAQANVTPIPLIEKSEPLFDPNSIPLDAVDSSCFSRIGYDEKQGVLVVEFLESGAVYAYYGFDEREYNDFIEADSLGVYFNECIKGSYDYERIK